MVNVDQLLKEQYINNGVISIGIGSYEGNVIIGRNWGDSMRKIEVPKAEEDSWEYYFYKGCKRQNRLLLMKKIREKKCMQNYIRHRAIGVDTNPNTKDLEIMPLPFYQNDMMFFYINKTRALQPIHTQVNQT